MTPVPKIMPKVGLPWFKLGWFALAVVICYAPILASMASNWNADPDMGHGFFVPLIVGYIIWKQKDDLLATPVVPDWRGLPVVVLGTFLTLVGTLGVEQFLPRCSFVITIIGTVWYLGGRPLLQKLAFPLLLLFCMIPIPAVIYNSITFPLQILASKLAFGALTLLDIPVLREGNILELPTQRLSVVEACSGIRSLLSLTFLGLVYGYFVEKRLWLRIVLFLSTIPIAILANGSRVTITGILSQIKPELAEGFFHESTGWIIFMFALGILTLYHQMLMRIARWMEAKRG